MRLTLRTLLAYLDDILEPAQAKEIGDKLNESSFASSLVSRIREVMRRRRLLPRGSSCRTAQSGRWRSRGRGHRTRAPRR